MNVKQRFLFHFDDLYNAIKEKVDDKDIDYLRIILKQSALIYTISKLGDKLDNNKVETILKYNDDRVTREQKIRQKDKDKFFEKEYKQSDYYKSSKEKEKK